MNAVQDRSDGEDGKYIGRPVPRLEDPRFLTGTARFVDDIKIDGMVHAVVVRSAHAHARLAEVGLGAAKSRPGVLAIVTADDIADYDCQIPLRLGPLPGFERFLQRPLASGVVRYVGEPIAVIVAETHTIAEDAAEEVAVAYEPIEAVVSVRQALTNGTVVHAGVGTNLATSYRVADGGDIEQAFADAFYTRKETFRCHRQTAAPMETRGLLAIHDRNSSPFRLRVFGAAKVAHHNRNILATLLRFPKDEIELVEVDIGGGFGARGEFYPEDFLIPFLAIRMGRPVKWIEDRREHLMATNHSREVECTLEIALNRDGTFRGLRGRICVDMGAYIRTNGGVVPSKTAQFLPGPYRIPSLAFQVEAAITNKTPTGTYRGPGMFEGNFFRERLLDLAAADLDLSAAEIRRRNLIVSSELPRPAPKLVPHEPSDSFDSGDYLHALERALAEIGYDKLVRRQRDSGPVRHGVGLCCVAESTAAGPYETARVRLTDEGRIEVHVGISVAGQGHETSLAQICAETVGVPISTVSVRHGTTSLVEHSFGTFHSRGAVMAGNATLLAARKMRDRMIETASRRLNEGVGSLDLRGGSIQLCAEGDRRHLLSLRDLASVAREFGYGNGEAALEEIANFEQKIKTYAYATHAAHVAVDIETGKVEVVRYLIVEDAGRAINPLIVHGQVIGGAVQGIGSVFLDEIVYGPDGQLLTGSFAEYLVATSTEFPNVDAISVSRGDSTLNHLGAKGAGEGGIIGTGAALANAVGHALAPLGVVVTSLPLNPNEIRRMLRTVGV